MLCGMEPLSPEEIRRAVRAALEEDRASGDVTTLAVVPEQAAAKAFMVAREPLVVAGLDFAVAAFRELDAKVEIERRAEDGRHLQAREWMLRIEGVARSILSAERVALNFVQRLSGVATLTAQFVEATKGTKAKILDTRKTTPGWRRFEKYAVTRGGGTNHRFGLHDLVLIKDNHLVAVQGEPPNPVEAAVRRARAKYPSLRIEVEVDNPVQLQQALAAGADLILLDNMKVEELRTAVRLINGKALTEASGGITLANVKAVAATGVDFISVGALTHSARAVDIALDFLQQSIA